MWVRCLGGEDPWRRKWQPTPVFLPEKSCGQRGLESCKESNTTEHICTLIRLKQNTCYLFKKIILFRFKIVIDFHGPERSFLRLTM